jgi:hypothetical protein
MIFSLFKENSAILLERKRPDVFSDRDHETQCGGCATFGEIKAYHNLQES